MSAYGVMAATAGLRARACGATVPSLCYVRAVGSRLTTGFRRSPTGDRKPRAALQSSRGFALCGVVATGVRCQNHHPAVSGRHVGIGRDSQNRS
jgi:hypothetical protein